MNVLEIIYSNGLYETFHDPRSHTNLSSRLIAFIDGFDKILI